MPGYRVMQGYLTSRPVAASKMTRFLVAGWRSNESVSPPVISGMDTVTSTTASP
jgi:hypothetical protein